MNYAYDPFTDVSQHRTEEVIFKFFASHPPTHTLLVDVGAYGRFMSNSWALLKLGWRGLLIEPNPARRKIIEEEFFDLDIELLPIGISTAKGRAPFYLHTTVGYDSLSPDWHAADKSGVCIWIDIEPLTDVLLCRAFPPDFGLLSIDTEGFDAKIVEDLFDRNHFKPALIVTEADSYPPTCDLFERHGYGLYAIAGPANNGNLIYNRL